MNFAQVFASRIRILVRNSVVTFHESFSTLFGVSGGFGIRIRIMGVTHTFKRLGVSKRHTVTLRV